MHVIMCWPRVCLHLQSMNSPADVLILLHGSEEVGMADVVKAGKDAMDDYKAFLVQINMSKA